MIGRLDKGATGKGKERADTVRVRYADNESQLTTRIKNLCAQGPDGVAAAIKLVKDSSVKVAKVAVWTQLMQELAKAERWKAFRDVRLEVKHRPRLQSQSNADAARLAAETKSDPARWPVFLRHV